MEGQQVPKGMKWDEDVFSCERAIRLGVRSPSEVRSPADGHDLYCWPNAESQPGLSITADNQRTQNTKERLCKFQLPQMNCITLAVLQRLIADNPMQNPTRGTRNNLPTQ